MVKLEKTAATHRPRHLRLPVIKFETKIALWLIFATAITEAHSVLYLLLPDVANGSASNWFMHRTLPFLLTIEWWVKSFGDQLLWCTTYFLMALIAHKYSHRLFYIVLIFFAYHFIDSFLLFWNWKQGFVKYYVLLGITISSTVLICLPIKNTDSKVVQM